MPFASLVEVTLATFVPFVTFDDACFTSAMLAALVPTVPPLATLLMTLPPALMPPLVMLTVLLVSAGFEITTPLVSNLVLPVVTLPVVPKSIFSASFTVKVSLPLATTPILLSVNAPFAPPLTLTVEPSLRVTLLPESPAKVSGWLTAVLSPVNAAPTLFTVVVTPVDGLVVMV